MELLVFLCVGLHSGLTNSLLEFHLIQTGVLGGFFNNLQLINGEGLNVLRQQ